MLQVGFIQCELHYTPINVTTQTSINFLQCCDGLTNLSKLLDLLQEYKTICPNLILKMPSHSGIPSIEIKVTSDIGASLILQFNWTFALKLFESFGNSTTNIAN
jgi:hypothetical protein